MFNEFNFVELLGFSGGLYMELTLFIMSVIKTLKYSWWWSFYILTYESFEDLEYLFQTCLLMIDIYFCSWEEMKKEEKEEKQVIMKMTEERWGKEEGGRWRRKQRRQKETKKKREKYYGKYAIKRNKQKREIYLTLFFLIFSIMGIYCNSLLIPVSSYKHGQGEGRQWE